MLTLLRLVNLILLVSLVGCIAGALAGLIVLVPFVAGAWVLNLIALAGYEERARPGWTERIHASDRRSTPARGEIVPIPAPRKPPVERDSARRIA